MKRLLRNIPVPKNVSATVIVVYAVYGLVGALTVFEAWREPPTAFYVYNYDAYWYVTGVAMALSGVVGLIGSWSGRWEIERIAVIVIMFAVLAQSVVTFYGLKNFDVQTPFFILSLAGTVGHFLTRWFRISKDYRDPTFEREQVRLEKREYEKALSKQRNN